MKENKRSQVELLERDVKIQFEEIRRLREENENLKETIKELLNKGGSQI